MNLVSEAVREHYTPEERYAQRTMAPQVISEQFAHVLRQTVQERNIPRRDAAAYVRLLTYLTLNPWKTAEGVVLPGSMMADFWERGTAYEWRNFESGKHLQQFNDRMGLNMEWSHYNWYEGQCRRITRVELPPALHAAVKSEQQMDHHAEGMVWLQDFKRLTPAKERALREQMRAEANALLDACKCPVAVRWMEYLNSHTSHRFKQVKDHAPVVRDHILATRHGGAQKQALRVLRNIMAQPLPFYRPTQNSVRLYCSSENLTAMPKLYRKMLCPSWVEADLKSCYFAISTELWGVPRARDFLGGGGNVWQHLTDWLQVEHNAQHKAALKEVFYGLFFCVGKKKVAQALTQHFGTGAHARFLANPLIGELLTARWVRAQRIKQVGYGITLHGERLDLQETRDAKGRRDSNVRSIMSQEFQAYEMELLSPVLELALRYREHKHGMSVTLYQHDGFSYVPHDPQDAREWQERLNQAVKAKAASLNICTCLEFS